MLLGVFDGHGGSACAQVISKRLLNYISACLLPPNILQKFFQSTSTDKNSQLLQTFNDKARFIDEIEKLYQESFISFLKDLKNKPNKEFQMEAAMEEAFLRLDDDISREALTAKGENVARTLSVAMSGAVAAVAHIDGPHLHVANVGDCQVVLGVLSGMHRSNITTKNNKLYSNEQKTLSTYKFIAFRK